MIKYSNIYILGTSHIAVQSIDEVKDAFEKISPDIIALELDPGRFQGLMRNKKHKIVLSDIKKFGIKGFTFNLLGAWMEKKLGEAVGTKPGDEMKKAAELAMKSKIPIALIDQDINITLRKLSKRLTWKEKFKFIGEVVASSFSRKNRIRINLSKVPEDKIIRQLTAKVKKDYPSVYLTLIEERNQIMAKALYNLSTRHENKKVLAIVGAGHGNELVEIIKCLKQDKRKETS